jgi:ribonuclease D
LSYDLPIVPTAAKRATPPFQGPMKDAVQYRDITTDEQLRKYCRDLSRAKSIAFDTEFVSEHTYRPVLCLIQVAADGELAVIDPIAIGDVTPFWEAIVAPGHETIVHAGRGELEFCLQAIDRWPERLFDVQIAAALAGAEYPAGLGSLISKFLGQPPPKHETRTDWRRRPLSKRQVEYAINDARFLQPLRDAIRAKLSDSGRLGWLDDEMESWREDIVRSLSQERWRRVSGNSGLDARTLAVVRELFYWRDGEAKRRNQPARRVLRDDLIVELARRGSADVKHIQAVRGMERGDLQRRMGELAAAIQRGLDMPEAECPVRPSRERVPELSVLGQFLFAALGSISREAQLAPNLVGTPSDIREWMAFRSGKNRETHDNPPQLAHGWRAEFVGRLFEDLLAGKLSVRIDDSTSDHPLAFERH